MCDAVSAPCLASGRSHSAVCFWPLWDSEFGTLVLLLLPPLLLSSLKSKSTRTHSTRMSANYLRPSRETSAQCSTLPLSLTLRLRVALRCVGLRCVELLLSLLNIYRRLDTGAQRSARLFAGCLVNMCIIHNSHFVQHNLHKYLYAFIGASRVVSLISRADCITFCCLCCVAFAFALALAFTFTCTMITLNSNAHTLCVCEVVCVPPPVCVASGQHGAAHCWGVCILLCSSLLLNSPSCSHSPLHPFTCGFCSSRGGAARRGALLLFTSHTLVFTLESGSGSRARASFARVRVDSSWYTVLYWPVLVDILYSHLHYFTFPICMSSGELMTVNGQTRWPTRPLGQSSCLLFSASISNEPDRTEPIRFDSCFIARRVLCKLLTMIRVLRSRTYWIFGIHSFKRTLKIIYV